MNNQNNREKIPLNGEWKLTWYPNSKKDSDITNFQSISAEVPGNFELDLYRAKIIGDPYFGVNTLKLQELECMHMLYTRKFIIPDDADLKSLTLCCDGIDAVSEIYVNGSLAGKTDNMLIPYRFTGCNLKNGENEITVHITPAEIAAREYDIPPSSSAPKYNASSLFIRKAPHMYGWDIMPRIISGGIWRDIYIEKTPENHIKDVFLYTSHIDTAHNTASAVINFNTRIQDDSLKGYTIKVKGVCGESVFYTEQELWHTSGNIFFNINGCKFWYPKNYGEPNLYNVTVQLCNGGKINDEIRFNYGARTVTLNRTSTTDKDGSGEFCFVINNKKVFAMGTNWVPVDAFHSNDVKRLPEILPMLNDTGCNIVRCWGGNVYEHDIFYDFCDANGIMVWQDFAMACAAYPQENEFLNRMENEVTAVIKRLRNHASIILWSGDNECDSCGGMRDPNKNLITRKIIPSVLDIHDFTRPYLPSSPYIDEYAYSTGQSISEDHLWGPRDYFKGPYYKNTVCHFASETGYHGCPSPESLAKYISKDKLWPWHNNEEWLVHAASMEISWGAPYAYRIKLMADQVETLFGMQPDNLKDFSLASQISQAEAKKYFIERFRISKWRRTGIIWWNLIDGWPQISDAVVDYYYDKKLAYYYIKRSQQPVCFMFGEPDDGGSLPLYAVNDTQEAKNARYKVTDITENRSLIESEITIPENTSLHIWNKNMIPNEQHFYLIEWDCGTARGKNHYMTNLLKIDFNDYIKHIKECGFEIYGDFYG